MSCLMRLYAVHHNQPYLLIAKRPPFPLSRQITIHTYAVSRHSCTYNVPVLESSMRWQKSRVCPRLLGMWWRAMLMWLMSTASMAEQNLLWRLKCSMFGEWQGWRENMRQRSRTIKPTGCRLPCNPPLLLYWILCWLEIRQKQIQFRHWLW